MKKLPILLFLVLIILLSGCTIFQKQQREGQQNTLEDESRMRNILEDDPRYEYDEQLGQYVRKS